jgi:hypothetical protein
MSNNSPLLCKNCKHSFVPMGMWPFFLISYLEKLFIDTGNEQYYYNCKKTFTEKKSDYNPVTGSYLKKSESKMCSTARGEYAECGPEGKLYIPRKKTGLFLAIKHSK